MGLTSIKPYFVLQQNFLPTHRYHYFIQKDSSWTHQQIATILLIPTPAAYNSTQNDVFQTLWDWRGESSWIEIDHCIHHEL